MSQITAIVQRIVMNADFNVSFYDRYNNLLLTLETATYAQVVNTYLICGDSDGNSIKFFVNEITCIEGPTFFQTYVPIVAGFYQQDQAYFNRLSEIYNYMETNVVNVVIRWIDALKFADGTTQTTAATGGGGSGTVTSVGFTAGTGITLGGTNPITTSGSVTITNSAPDQVVSLTEGAGIDITGTYPNFTISNTIDPSAFVPYTGATTNVDLGEYELKAGQIEFDQTPTGTAGVAVMRWNDSDGTVDLGMKGGNVTLQIGQEQLTRVVNKTGSDLLEANYQAVKISGAQGNRLKVALAQANNDANSAETLGIVTETILNNQEGFVTTSGIVRGINTTGSLQSETWADGDMLYLSGTIAGQLTNIKPTAPIHTVIMGYVVRAHATQGQLYVKVDNGYELNELHDVAVGSYGTKDVLWRDTATNLWKNKDIFTLIGPASTSTDGYLTSTDWNTFNNKGTGNGTVISIATTSPILGGPITTSGTISIQQANSTNNGYLSSTDWVTFRNKQDAITLTTTGTSGAATLVGSTLNIPQYSGGSSSSVSFQTVVGSATGLAAATTRYGNVAGTTAESQNRVPVPVACTISDLYVRTTATMSATASLAVTITKNGVATAVTLVIAGGSVAGTYSSTMTSVAFTAGDGLNLQYTNAGTTAAAASSGTGYKVTI